MKHLSPLYRVLAASLVISSPLAAQATPESKEPSPSPIYVDSQVDKPAMGTRTLALPRYPDRLRGSGISGEALVEFVIDVDGIPETKSFKVIRATHPEFGESVLRALPLMRFVPAEKNGVRVRQLVRHPWVWQVQP